MVASQKQPILMASILVKKLKKKENGETTETCQVVVHLVCTYQSFCDLVNLSSLKLTQ